MSDLERLKALLDDWDVPYKEDGEQDGTGITVGGFGQTLGGNPKVDGYIGFYTRFEFTRDGVFRLMGAWE